MIEHKQVEEMLWESGERFRTIFNTAQVIVLVLDTTGRIVLFNPCMEELSGYSLTEVQGKDWFSTFLPTQDHEEIKKVFQKAVDDIQTRGNINPIMTKDGSILDIEWCDKTLKDDNGKVIGVLAIGQDITERKEAEEELKQSEKKLNKMFQFADHMVCVADLKRGYFLKVSPAFTTHLGWSEQTLLSRPILDFLHPDDIKKTADCIEEQMEEGVDIVQFVNRYKTNMGDYRWLEWSSNPIPEEGITYAAAYDITERKEAEKARDMLWNVFNYIDSMSLILDENMKIVLVNRYATKILGYKEADELVGKSWLDFISKDQKNIVARVHNKIMNNSKEVEDHISEVISKHKTTSVKWFISRLDEKSKGTFSLGVPILKEINEQTNISGVRSYFKNMIQKDKENINSMRDLIIKNGE